MSMKQMKSIILLTAMTALAACSSEDTAQQRQDDSLVPITFSAVDIQLMTRAADGLLTGNFGAGKDINVSIKAGSAAAADYTFSTAAGGGMSLKETDPAQSGPYYPAGDNATIIKAWYPADASATFAVSTAQNVDANYEASDLMYGKPWETSTETYIDGCSIAKPTTNPAPDVNLKFEHLLAKVRVKLTKGTGVTSITGITLKGIKTSATFDKAAGTATTIDGTTGNITVASSTSDIADGTTYFAAVIPEQTLGDQFLEITTAQGTAYYSASKLVNAGHVYTVELTVNSLAIGMTTQITSWGESIDVPSVGGLQAAFTIPDIDEQEYTGLAKEPTISNVQCNGITIASSNYDVYYADNVIPGTANVIVVGKGDYAGIYGSKEFTIRPKTVDDARDNTYRGWVIASDGYIYKNKADVAKTGKTGVAMIVHVGANGENSPYNHGLGMALTMDASSKWTSSITDLSMTKPMTGAEIVANVTGIANTNTIISNYSVSAASAAKNHASQVTKCSQWFLPAIGQWIYVFNNYGANITKDNATYNSICQTPAVAATVNTALTTALENAGGVGGVYSWASTEFSAQYAYRPYVVNGEGIYVGYSDKQYGYTVRAFLAF